MTPVERVALPPSSGCGVECRLELLVEDRRVLGLGAADGAAPCVRCRVAHRSLAADRLRTPLRPSADRRRGEGRRLEPCSWDEALERLAAALDEVRRGRMGLTWIAAGRYPRARDVFALRACALLGNGRFLQETVPAERIARWAATRIAEPSRASPEELATAGRVVVWGADPATGPASLRRAFLAAAADPLVVDPAASASCRPGSLHLALRPGTDVALSLGLVGALGRSTEAESGSWSLDRSAEVCGLPPAQLRRAVRLLGETTRPGVAVLGAGLLAAAADYDGLDAAALVARAARLRLVLPRPAVDPVSELAMPPDPAGGAPRRRSLWEDPGLLEEVDAADQVVIIDGGDPLAQWEEGEALREWLERVRLLVVLGGPSSTAARLADFVLPTPEDAERRDVAGLNWEGPLRAGGGAVPAPRGVRSVRAIWAALARRLGLPGDWFQGLDLGEAAAALPVASERPAVRESSRGPRHRETGEGPLATPRAREAFGLQLVLARAIASRGGPTDREGLRFCIGREEARNRGLRDGQQVVVHNERATRRGLLLVGEQPRGILIGRHPPVFPGEPGLSGLLPRGEAGLPGRRPCLVEVAPADPGERS